MLRCLRVQQSALLRRRGVALFQHTRERRTCANVTKKGDSAAKVLGPSGAAAEVDLAAHAKTLGIRLSLKEQRVAVKAMDKDGNGIIGLEEFNAWILKQGRADKERQALLSFIGRAHDGTFAAGLVRGIDFLGTACFAMVI
jgi:hypothetical protein